MPNFSIDGGKMEWVIFPAVLSFQAAAVMLSIAIIRSWVNPKAARDDMRIRGGAFAFVVWMVVGVMLLLLRLAPWDDYWQLVTVLLIISFAGIVLASRSVVQEIRRKDVPSRFYGDI